MKLVLVGALILILLAGTILLYRDYYVRRKLKKNTALKYHLLGPLIHDLTTGGEITIEKVTALAEHPSLRHAVFKVLEAYNKADLFPAEYFNHEKGAESFLVTWLEFPTELGATPDEIEFMKKVSVDNDTSDYYVFKYRSTVAHWSEYNWMIGVCGPYHTGSMPFDVPLRIFSRFNSVGSISPEQEVQWVHEHIRQ